MHYYKIEIIETEGRLNESNGPAPAVVYLESNKCLSERQALICASKKYKNAYGAKIVVADVEQISEGVWDSIKGAASGLGAIGKAAGGAIAKGAKKVGGAVANGAKAVGGAVANTAKAAGSAVANGAKAAGGAVANKAGAVKNKYVNARNASRMNSIVKNVTNIVNSQIAPQIQSASKFGGFTVEQLQQIKGIIDEVMNGAAVQNQNNAQAQGPNEIEQNAGDMTQRAMENSNEDEEGFYW